MRFFPAAFLCLAAATPASATDFVVTKTADTADGVCDADCSLREAIIAANANAGPDKVILGNGQTYVLTLGPFDAPGAVTPASGDLDITDSLIIEGNQSTINGNDLDRVLDIAGAITVTINSLTIRGGLAQGFLSLGGGIRIRNAAVTLNGSSVIFNATNSESGSRDNGGGIAVIGTYNVPPAAPTVASLAVVGSVIDSNAGRSGGGVVCVLCTLSFSNTAVTLNTADADGGGIDVLGNASTSAATSSRIAGNIAGVRGGGVATPYGTSVDTWTRSSIQGNQSVTGSGVFNNVATVTATNNWWGCNYGP